MDPVGDSQNRAICLVGAQPPPRHGVSAVNEALLGCLQARAASVKVVNNASDVLLRSWRTRFSRLMRYAKSFIEVARFCSANPGGCVYASVGGGYGLLYDSLLLAYARNRGMKVMVHHHSFHYANHGFAPARILFRAVGSGAVHVVLGKRMAQLLARRYAPNGHFHVLSNARFVDGPAPRPDLPREGRRVGLMANLSQEKGLEDFLILAKKGQQLNITWVLAGPFMDPRDEMRCRAALRKNNNLKWIGPVYGAEKTRYLSSLDAFVFPTRYINEAEPLVVLEAMRLGVPVIAYGRGCIPEMLGACGACVSPDRDFAVAALAVLRDWLGSAVAAREQRERTVAQYRHLFDSSAASLEQLLDSMLNHGHKNLPIE